MNCLFPFLVPRHSSGDLFFLAANVLMSELEEARMLLDTAERARRGIEGEIGDTRESIGALTNTNALLAVDKRRLEGDIRCVLCSSYSIFYRSTQSP